MRKAPTNPALVQNDEGAGRSLQLGILIFCS